MPKFLENKLKKEASKKGLKGKRADAYVFGTMNKMGVMKGNKETAKGMMMDKKHTKDMKKKMSVKSARNKYSKIK